VRSVELPLDKYDSDKLHYLKIYDPIFEPYVQKKITLLELGVLKGGSLLLWRDYFPLGTIAGIDKKLPDDFDPGERIHIFEGNQADPQFLSRVANNIASDGFDIIIDDASHIGKLTKTAFWHLFDNHLKPNGLYAIEDWMTGYWSDRSDGRCLNLESYTHQPNYKRGSFWLFLLNIAAELGLRFPMRNHCYGMVGFIKQLVDEQAAYHVTRRTSKGNARRSSKFENMIITPSIVLIRKALDNGQLRSI